MNDRYNFTNVREILEVLALRLSQHVVKLHFGRRDHLLGRKKLPLSAAQK